MKKVIVCGGRDFKYKDTVYFYLDQMYKSSGGFSIIEGGARGVDRLAREWATERGVPYLTVDADWEKFGRSAGPIRNAAMLDLEPDYVIAFPGGLGTKNMCQQARKKGVQVIEVKLV